MENQIITNILIGKKRSARHLKLDVLHVSNSKSLILKLLDLSEDWFLIHARRRVVYANPATARAFGAVSVKEFVGREVLSLVSPEHRERISKGMDLLDQGISIESHALRVIRLDGSTIDIETNNLPIYYEGKPAIFVIGRDISWRRQVEIKMSQQVSQLSALRLIDRAILSEKDLKQTLEVILRQLTSALQVDAADFLLYDPEQKTLVTAAAYGLHSNEPIWLPGTPLNETHAGRVAVSGELEFVANLGQFQDHLTERIQQVGEHFSSYLAVQLQAKGELKGVLQIYQRNPLTPDEDWFAFLKSLVDQAAIAISIFQLFEALKQSNHELIAAYEMAIDGWSRALDLRDAETEGHSQRVTDLTLELARRMGIIEEQIVNIRRGARLHDIGKLGIPDYILHKPGELTAEEWETMRRHPTLALDLLQPLNFLASSLEIPYGHHEKWDGSGYPQGLKEEAIPLSARIFAVIDVWDALTHSRPYRPALSKDKALRYIREQSGKHFDPQVVAQFLALLLEKPSI